MRQKLFTTVLVICLCVAVIPIWGTPQADTDKETKTKRVKIKDLEPVYRQWWDLVQYIITPTEREVFLSLTNNLDRDAFITLFWSLRDPTKGTPQNEFQEEHIKRFRYANRYFRDTPGPGWRSDRGRMYILLGPPVSSEEVIQNGLYPVLIWEYYGGGDTGFPTVYRIVFYKRYGSGGYKLYIPAVDGPASLLQTQIAQIDPNDYADVYDKIKEISAPVAEICLTLIPGEPVQSFSPSLQDPILIGRIYDLPQRKINTNYAKNFLQYKGYVETRVVTNYINMKTDLYIIKNPLLNLNFVHLALLPERLSVDYSEDKDQYYFNFQLMVILKKGEDVIFQYGKDFPFYYSKEDLDRKLSNGIIIMDYFPVIEGEYQLVAILENSLNKEISYYERKIRTDSVVNSPPQVFGPFVSYQVNPPSQLVFAPFNIMGTVINVDPQRAFGLKDSLYSIFIIDRGTYKKNTRCQLEVESLDENRPYRKTYSVDMTEMKKFEIFTQPLEKLNYGNYKIKTSLLGEDNSPLDEKENDFMVSPLSVIAHPPFASKALSNENRFLFYTMVAQQYENIKDFSKAEFYYEEAFGINPSYPQLLKLYAQMLLNRGKYDQVLTVIENLKNQEKETFSYYAYRGKALYYLGKYQEAVDVLLEANKIYDSDVGVLNALGLSLIRIGEKEEAVKALSASLKINEAQADIAAILQQLKGEKNDPQKKK